MILHNNLPLIMIVAFLLLTLVIGIYYSRKVNTFREYAIGNKQFATATLVATTLATIYGGAGLLRTVEQVYVQGLFWVLIISFYPIYYWLLAPLMLRMGLFMQHLSVAESIGSIYGKGPRLVAALASTIACIIIIAMQIIAITRAIEMCINLDNSGNAKIMQITLTVTATCILIFYSMLGGIRSVTFTDVLQFLIFTTVIPCTTWFILKATNQPMIVGASSLYQEPKFQLDSCLTTNKLLALVSLFLARLTCVYMPTNIQRIYMAFNPIQARNLLIHTGTFMLIINVCIVLIGLSLFVKAPTLSALQIWPYIFESMPTIFKGFMAISLLAMAMSTADSYLNVCSVIVSHDIIGSIQTSKVLTDKYKLVLARLTALTMGICAMLLAFHKKDLIELMMSSMHFYAPTVIAPFFLALYGFRGSSYTALIGMLTGLSAMLVWNHWVAPMTGIDGTFLCMLANGLAMLMAHYLLPQPTGTGWFPTDKFYTQKQ
ncbi:sodium:solute symporter family protein [Candidatus Cardinium hertigii]|uniref:High-affinity proline transporter PutP n=1 Tax=Candidatus Cardinium hertigii TaxID=247481 RepID=A0A2Z3L751_9BACT|nr:sodium:solute symporter family protein [Candidatus Cardinium hertigii]AWN81463.1 High-affinity proline transporter PutP [Candidatus Cardinium hertigii]